MSTLSATAPTVKPITPTNPRDSWPSWVDENRWGILDVEGEGAPSALPPIDLDDADTERPTAGPDFSPTAEEEAEAVELFNISDHDDEPTDAEWDRRADDAFALAVVSSGLPWL